MPNEQEEPNNSDAAHQAETEMMADRPDLRVYRDIVYSVAATFILEAVMKATEGVETS